ncbi:hypothetical protein HWV62_2480 [Athelia sp. TMB]|nr:hypothetical protein HWV62_2480 [Athelia sp. TMB]
MSSLAAQLTQNASLNASLLSTSRRKPTESYLFPPSQASTHDLESIHFLAANAFLQLKSVQPACRKYEAALFSDAIKDLDRTLLNKDSAGELNENLAAFLRLLGPWVMEGMVGKILEWLVRRFRINEFNVEDVLSLFLPYHESPHFAKMLSILHIPPQSTFSFLLPFKGNASHLPRTALVTAMLSAPPVARFVALLLPRAHEGGYAHRTLLAFNIGVMHAYIVRAKSIDLDEGVVGLILGPLVDALKASGSADPNVVLGSYVLLSTLSAKITLAPAALKAVIGAMAGVASRVATGQFLRAAVAVCEPQSQVEAWGENIIKNILKLTDIGKEVGAAIEWMGSEKFFTPLLSGLVTRLPQSTARDILHTFAATPLALPAILNPLASLLLASAISNPEEATYRTLLASIQQRHPGTLRTASEVVIQEAGEGSKEGVEQVVISLSVTFGDGGVSQNKKSADLVLASTSADENVRVIAVQGLLSALGGAEPVDEESIKSALLARAHDSSAAVVDALYTQPAIVLSLLATPAVQTAYVSTVSATLTSAPSRALIRTHLTFLAEHFSHFKDVPVFEQCFFPFLLFSKGKKETARMVWELVERVGIQAGTVGAYEVLRGAVDAWRWQMDRYKSGEGKVGAEVETNPVEWMASANMAVAARIAVGGIVENILTSHNYETHLSNLLEKMNCENPHPRALAYLVARALVGGLSADRGRQLDAATRMLAVMHLSSLDGMEDIPGGQDSQMLVNDKSLGLKIVLKPAGRNTTYYLKSALLSMLLQIARPGGVVLDWYAKSAPSETQGARYASLMRTIYRLANTSVSLPVLSTSIIRALFLTLKEDALAFLAGTVVSTLEAHEDQSIAVAALRHAAAFMTSQPHVDFQTVLPSFIVAIASDDADIRQAALECISVMANSQKNFVAVYGFDTIYGEGSKTLQYLDVADLSQYLNSIVDASSLLSQDGNYIKIFHKQALSRSRSGHKAQTKHKQNVLSYLLSHANALSSPKAQITLLATIADISDEIKMKLLVSKAQDLTLSSASVGQQMEEYATLVVASFDNSAVDALNLDGDAAWPAFLSIVSHYFRSVLMDNIDQNIFAGLSTERQLELCIALLHIGAHDPNAVQCKKLLGNVVKTTSLVQSVLARLQPPGNQVSPAKKRAKLDKSVPSIVILGCYLSIYSDVTPDDSFTLLTTFVEVLAARDLPGSIDLVSRLLDTLNNVMHYEAPAQGDKSFVEQLIMSAIGNSAEKVTEIPNLSPSAIRLDILVELIRVSDNTQTFHQALLLMADLARLTPESVLHNIMPVFTFMGSNVFHRDDTYSFRVVQQTVNSIVPVMVSSLKSKHVDRLELCIASRDFLHIFTDAAHHIPRHRRTKFFSHLVDVMGPGDFLAPVCMLLIEKVANRIHRQNVDEVQASFALPVSILQQYTAEVQVTVLINFVGHALQTLSTKLPGGQTAGKAIGEIIALLVQLVTLRQPTGPDNHIDGVVKAARATMTLSLGVMPAAEFIQIGALDVLANRLEMINANVRRSVSTVVVNIIDRIRTLVSGNDDSLAEVGFSGLKAIGITSCSGEENALANTLPSILAAIHNRKGAELAMASLLPLVSGLGPRLIPNFRNIVSECTQVIRANLQSNIPISALATDALSVLRGLLVAIPTFWGNAELVQVIKLHIDHTTTAKAQSSATTALMKALTKRTPSKVLISSMCQIWPLENSASNTGQDRMVAYFGLLKQTLRAASRPIVLENIRSLFQVFLEGFDAPSTSSQVDPEAVEAQSVPAFLELVVKLNEAAFRPLFRKLYDWAFGFTTSSIVDKALWSGVILALTESFTSDEGVFWHDDKSRQIAPILISQVAVCARLGAAESKLALARCLDVMTESVTDDALLKSTNLGLLMHTRSEDARLRIFALSCSELLWRSHGGKLLGFVTETTTFIAECAEDENDLVVKEARRLKHAVESVAGNINV